MKQNNLVIGLTGGIASGKSTVSEHLKSKGLPVVDADLVARQVVQPNTRGLKEIVTVFGEEVLEGESLNRRKLREIIFSNEEKRLALNRILHPIIHEEILLQLDHHKKSHELIVFDAPLLLENDLKYMVDELWLVVCDEETQIKRVMARDQISEKEAKKILNSQMPLKEKVKKSDVLIENDGTLEELLLKVDQLISTRLQK
jgi:dephospho-CoA kinase